MSNTEEQISEISYSIITFWVFNDDDIRAIEEECRELADNNDAKIKYIKEKKLFDIKGTDYHKLDKVRDRLFEILTTKSNKQGYGVPRYKKKEPKYEESTPGLPPPLVEDVPLMIEEKEEIPEGVVGVFLFGTQIRTPDHINDLFGSNQQKLFIHVDYWRDICTSCKVNGEIVYDKRKIEFTEGKSDNLNKARRKLRQLEKNYLRETLHPIRVPLIHFSNTYAPFKINFCLPQNHPYFKDASMEYFNDVCILSSQPEPNSKGLNDDEKAVLDKKIRNFNLNKMSNALKKGLEYVRVHQGEIRFYGSLGKVMFSKTNEVKGKFWNFTELEDVISKYKIKSRFDEDATHDNLIYEKFDGYFSKERKKDYTEYFEIKADARNSPNDIFTEVYMRVNRSTASLVRVGSEWEPLVNIDWTLLNMKSDIAINLATRRIIRHDIEPFASFNKRISIDPKVDSAIAYENVDKRIKSKKGPLYDTFVRYLEVKSIDFKKVTTKKVNDFTLQLTRVERLNVSERPKTNKGLGESTGDNRDVYYTIEVFSEKYNTEFEQNISLESGDIASWTVDTILGEEPNYNLLCEFVRTLLITVRTQL